MAPWTGEDDQKSQVRKLVKRLLQKPKGAPRGPTGFAVEAIKQLGFDPESKGQIRSFISKGAADGSSLIPDEHQYAVVEVPSVTFTAPKTKCPDIFYKGPDLIVKLDDYFDDEGNVIEQVELLKGQEVTTVAQWKAYLASLGKGCRKKEQAVTDCLNCYFSHHKGSGRYSDEVLEDLEALGCTAFPWADAKGDEHEDFLGVRNHPDLDKLNLGQDKGRKKVHDDKNLNLMKNERNPRPGKAPSMKRMATYAHARRRRALCTAHSYGWPPPLSHECYHQRYLEKAQVPGGKVTARGVWNCDLCQRDVMDGAVEIRGELIGNVIEEHEEESGKARENVLDHFCNMKVRPTTDSVKDHLTKDQMRGFARCLCLATGRPVPGALQAERDLVAECLVAAREAESPWDDFWADARERGSLLERRAAGEMRRGAGGAASLARSRSPPPSSSRAPSPPQTPSSLPPLQELVSPLSVQSVSSRQSIGELRERLRERARAARKRRRSSSRASPSPLKRRRRGADADADALVVEAGNEVVRVCSMLSKIARSGSSSSAEAGAALASLKLFLTKV